MGSVAEAVLEFDEAVQVPWRPPLAAGYRRGGQTALSVVPATGAHRPHAVRAARLAAPAPVPSGSVVPGRRASVGSTAMGHVCVRCAGAGPAVRALRLTRRARRLLGVLAAAGSILLAVWAGSVVGGSGEDLVLVSEGSVVVRQGDTLWSIAGSVADDRDVRAVVDAIRELNGLSGTQLRPGQVLRLP